jgi:hypothetical protein
MDTLIWVLLVVVLGGGSLTYRYFEKKAEKE